MKLLSLVFRIVSLVIILALAVFWFLKKDELSAISEAYESAQQQMNMSEAPLSEVLSKGMSDLAQTKSELRASTARATNLEQQLTGTREELANTEDQLRSTNQTLRSTRRDLEAKETEAAEAKQRADRLSTETETARQDLIRVNREKFEVTQQLESAKEETRALSRRVEQLESIVQGEGAPAVDEDGVPIEDQRSEEIARLEGRLESANREISRLQAQVSPVATALGDYHMEIPVGSNQVRVQSVNQRQGIIVLTPNENDDYATDSRIVIDRDGSRIAELRLRTIYPNFIVAEIMPSSLFPSELKQGSIYSVRR